MNSPFKLLAIGIMVVWSSVSAANGIGSSHYPTRTDIQGTDLKRIAALSHAIAELTGRLQYELFRIAPEHCRMSYDCGDAARYYVTPIANQARALAEHVDALIARVYSPNTGTIDIDAEMNALRVSDFNLMAQVQANFRGLFSGPTTGSPNADLACRDVLDVYWVLMNQIVNYPRPAGLAGDRGTDNG